jgi:hypothetical protein
MRSGRSQLLVEGYELVAAKYEVQEVALTGHEGGDSAAQYPKGMDH